MSTCVCVYLSLCIFVPLSLFLLRACVSVCVCLCLSFEVNKLNVAESINYFDSKSSNTRQWRKSVRRKIWRNFKWQRINNNIAHSTHQSKQTSENFTTKKQQQPHQNQNNSEQRRKIKPKEQYWLMMMVWFSVCNFGFTLFWLISKSICASVRVCVSSVWFVKPIGSIQKQNQNQRK